MVHRKRIKAERPNKGRDGRNLGHVEVQPRVLKMTALFRRESSRKTVGSLGINYRSGHDIGGATLIALIVSLL